MKKYYGHPDFVKYVEEMKEIHSSKNHDYADQKEPLSNFRLVYELTLGIPDSPFKVSFTRLVEKVLRIKEIASKGNKVIGESIIDSLMDLANYSILGRILIEEYEDKVKDDIDLATDKEVSKEEMDLLNAITYCNKCK